MGRTESSILMRHLLSSDYTRNKLEVVKGSMALAHCYSTSLSLSNHLHLKDGAKVAIITVDRQTWNHKLLALQKCMTGANANGHLLHCTCMLFTLITMWTLPDEGARPRHVWELGCPCTYFLHSQWLQCACYHWGRTNLDACRMGVNVPLYMLFTFQVIAVYMLPQRQNKPRHM